jgi:hypothetical protein
MANPIKAKGRALAGMVEIVPVRAAHRQPEMEALGAVLAALTEEVVVAVAAVPAVPALAEKVAAEEVLVVAVLVEALAGMRAHPLRPIPLSRRRQDLPQECLWNHNQTDSPQVLRGQRRQ